MTQPAAAAGRIEISRRAITTVVAEAVAACYGVVGMAPRNFRDGLDTILRRENADRGIVIRMNKGAIDVDVYVIVEYGTRVREVARNIAESVHFAIERSLGVRAHHVTVSIQGLRVSEDAPRT